MSAYRREKKRILKQAALDPEYAEFVRRKGPRGRIVWFDFRGFLNVQFKAIYSPELSSVIPSRFTLIEREVFA